MYRYVGTLAFAFSAVALGAAGDISKVNGSIDVAADQQAGDVSTVNGSITVGSGGGRFNVSGRVTLGEARPKPHLNRTRASRHPDRRRSDPAADTVAWPSENHARTSSKPHPNGSSAAAPIILSMWNPT